MRLFLNITAVAVVVAKKMKTNREIQSSSTSQSEWVERIQEFLSIDIDPNTGSPIVVGQGEEGHIAIYKINKENTEVLNYKVLPRSVTSGDVFVNLSENSILPFSFEVVVSNNAKYDLSFNFNVPFEDIVREPDAIIFSGNKQQNTILPPSKTDISTHLKNINTEIWTGDQSGIKLIKIGDVTNMPYEDFTKAISSFNAPVFSWENTPITSQERFILGKSNGNVEVYDFEDSSNDMKIHKYIHGESSPIQESPITGITKNNNGYYFASNKNGIIKINSIGLKINNFIYDVHSPIMSCGGVNQRMYAIINEGNDILQINQDFSQNYINGFSSLVKVIWSQYHQSLITCGINSVSIYQNKKITINESDIYTFYDVDSSKDGLICMLLGNGYDSFIKILNRDLSLKFNISTPRFKMIKCLFANEGYLYALAEKDLEYTVFIADLNNGKLNSLTPIQFDSPCCSFVYNSALDSFFIFTQNGRYAKIKNKGVETLKTLSEPPKINVAKNTTISIVSVADQLIRPVISTDKNYDSFKQSKVRVFVGSKMWQNDRWDSGEIKSSKTSILYGGGNNLKPGYKYYVHILTFCKATGWGNVQIKEFISPR